MILGFPVIAQQKRIQLGSVRSWVRSLASLIGLRIRHCHELWCRSQTQLKSGVAVAVVQAGSCSSNSTPSLGTSRCPKCGPKNMMLAIVFFVDILFQIEEASEMQGFGFKKIENCCPRKTQFKTILFVTLLLFLFLAHSSLCRWVPLYQTACLISFFLFQSTVNVPINI